LERQRHANGQNVAMLVRFRPIPLKARKPATRFPVGQCRLHRQSNVTFINPARGLDRGKRFITVQPGMGQHTLFSTTPRQPSTADMPSPAVSRAQRSGADHVCTGALQNRDRIE
jgi:hypothetical protein